MVLIAPIQEPEIIVYSSNNVQLKIGNKIIGKGALYISPNSLSWQSDDMQDGISIPWKQISVHGITSTPAQNIFFMLDYDLRWPGVYEHDEQAALNGNYGAAGDAALAAMNIEELEVAEDNGAAAEEEEIPAYEVDEGNVSDEDEEQTQLWLIPDDINTVGTIYAAMTDCQALHPDSADSFSEESDFMDDDNDDNNDEPNMGGGAGDANNGGGNDAAAAAAQGAMQNLNLNDERFRDAEE